MMLLAGCERSGDPAVDSLASGVVPGWQSAALELPPIPGTAPYHAITVRNGGRVVVSTTLRGALPPSGQEMPQRRRQACGPTFGTPAIFHAEDRLANVIVWIADIRIGKRLPLERRFVMTNVSCSLEPRVQAVVTGGTLNVRSLDSLAHATRLHVARTGAPLAVIRMADPGSVVPVEGVFARPGLIEARCDMHPWTLGWIKVFDHPYFAVTGRDGTSAIEEVPPGRYTVYAWHEQLGVEQARIEVGAGRETKVELRFPVRPRTLR